MFGICCTHAVVSLISDYLDKGALFKISDIELVLMYVLIGVDYAQQHVLGQGPQNNESAVEQVSA